MTTNRRRKKDARARQKATGERYTTAHRHTARITRRFQPDHCANCMTPLPERVKGLFCSELCHQTANTVRYWRRIIRDRRIEQPDVKRALRTRIAHLLAGGYAEQARRLPQAIRQQVWARDNGLCRACGRPGEEIDHINGDSSALINLQLLCRGCHHAKTESRMVPAGPQQQQEVAKLLHTRVEPNEPALRCDDEILWASEWRQLAKERRERLLNYLTELGFDRHDFPGYSWEDMWHAILDEEDDHEDEDEYWDGDEYFSDSDPSDYDGGYGPNSYFAHAMAKDD